MRAAVCAGAVLRYCQTGELGNLPILPVSLQVYWLPSASACQLTLDTIRCLDIVSEGRHACASKWNLNAHIQPYVATSLGKRLLRASLLQPLTSVPTITNRQDAIQELHDQHATQADVQTFLKEFPKDLDGLLLNLATVLTETARNNSTRQTSFIKAMMQLRNMLRQLLVRRPLRARGLRECLGM